MQGDPGAGDGGSAQRGWYPDYDAPPGHERFWDGAGWTEERRAASPSTRPRTLVWVGALVVALVVAAVVVVAVSRSGDSLGPAPVEPAAERAAASSPAPADRRTWTVASVADGATVVLDNGAVVRLVGIAVPASCAPTAAASLAELVAGRSVTLTRRGPDRDADGRLLRYVEVAGVDVGLQLVRRGSAAATDERHPRGEIYRRVAARTSPTC